MQAEKSCRTSKRLARKAVEDAEVEAEEDQAEQEEPSASPKTCDPNLTDVQSTSIPSSNINTCMYHSVLVHIQVVYSPCTKHLLRYYRAVLPFKWLHKTNTHSLYIYIYSHGWLTSSRGQLWVSMFNFIVALGFKYQKCCVERVLMHHIR